MWKWSVVCVVSVVLLFINDVVQKFSCFERWIAYWYRGFHFTKVQIKIQDRNPAFFHSFLFCCGCTDNGPRKAKSGPTNYCPCDTTLGFGDCFFTNFFNSVCFQFRKFENYWMRPQFLLIGDTGHFVCRINEDISTTQVRFCHIRVEVLKSYCISSQVAFTFEIVVIGELVQIVLQRPQIPPSLIWMGFTWSFRPQQSHTFFFPNKTITPYLTSLWKATAFPRMIIWSSCSTV